MICKTKNNNKRRKRRESANNSVFKREVDGYDYSPVLEQLLIMLVGMADTLVVSYAGEAAVSGVSLVNQFNTILFICLQHWHLEGRL